VLLKFVCLLFPASDYRHPVVTPAMILAVNALSAIRFNNKAAIAAGLYLAALVVEVKRISPHFLPPPALSGMAPIVKESRGAVGGEGLPPLSVPAVDASNFEREKLLRDRVDERGGTRTKTKRRYGRRGKRGELFPSSWLGRKQARENPPRPLQPPFIHSGSFALSRSLSPFPVLPIPLRSLTSMPSQPI